MNSTRRLLLSPGWLSLCLVFALRGPGAAAEEPIAPADRDFFEAKIRPVLVEHCYACHSAAARAKKKLRGGLLLDSREGLRAGGDSGPVVLPGKAADSLLMKTLLYTGDVKMPPRQKLSDRVVADFATWINRGAPDPRTGGGPVKQVGLSLAQGRAFWAYKPMRNATPPLVKDKSWPGNEIDAFILAAIEAKGLRPAPDADRATLIRRVFYDLIGLPPSPEEIDAFAADNLPDAFERLIDRLLASPAFGERWGRHWLDVARFGESMTLRGFVFREAWRYRDYVIQNFNADRPFDQFIQEQVAGDLLPAASLEQKRRQVVATSFLALGNTNLEEQDKKQLRMDVVDEQLDTLGRAFLAQTLGCARCHDHKFDPVPTRDYYALAGILRNTRTLTHANVSMWLERPLPAAPERERALQAHEKKLAALKQQIRTLKNALIKPGSPTKPTVRAVADLPGIVVDDVQAKKVGEWKESKYSSSYVGAGYLHDNNTGKGEKTITFQPEIPTTGKYEVRLAYSASANRCTRTPVTVFSADGEKTFFVNQRQAPEIEGLFHSLGTFTFERSGQGFVLIANKGTKGVVIADAVVFIPVGAKAPRTNRPEYAQLSALEGQLKKLTASGPQREMVMTVEEEPVIEDVLIHVRGSVHNLGDKAPRGFLQVATTGPAPAMPANASGRRELADWLARGDNPLTARVFVNRTWHWLFGEGLVRTPDNFGTTGEMPSHLELLDHLALRFIADGWSVKKLVRRIVLSHTYRLASTIDEPARTIDPDNRLLSHAHPRRLEAECLRDTILAVSGQLTYERGGASFPSTLATDYAFRHTETRRSVYSPVFRNALPELFQVFDFADPSVSTGRRNVSTVAPQALFLMNNSFILEQSRHAARRLLAEPWDNDRERIDRAYRWTLGRSPTEGERRLAGEFLGESPAAAREEAWGELFQVLFGSIDFRHVN